jgi:hypothetical protein
VAVNQGTALTLNQEMAVEVSQGTGGAVNQGRAVTLNQEMAVVVNQGTALTLN